MKDGWRLAEPALRRNLRRERRYRRRRPAAVAGDGDLENLRFFGGEMAGLTGKTLDVRGWRV